MAVTVYLKEGQRAEVPAGVSVRSSGTFAGTPMTGGVLTCFGEDGTTLAQFLAPTVVGYVVKAKD